MQRFFGWEKSVHTSLMALVAAIAALSSNTLQASSDLDCPPPLTAFIRNTAALECRVGIGNAVLNPYNDSRVNLLLAMTRPASNQVVDNRNILYWDATANPIQSPFYLEAIQGSARTAEETTHRTFYTQFIDLLHYLGLDEDNASAARINKDYPPPSLAPLAYRALALQEIIRADAALNEADRQHILKYVLQLENSPEQNGTKDYLSYISAANAFYADDYATAEQLFSALSTATTAWVKEAALYNLIRVEIRKAQRHSGDSYGFFDLAKVDQAQARKILPAIQRYLQEFPQGRFVDSATQLQRRAYWLSQDTNKLLQSYVEAINAIRHTNDFLAAANLAAEIDNKYLFPAPSENADADKLPASLAHIAWDNAIVATAQILVRLRKPAANDTQTPYNPVTLDAIKSHETQFKQQNAASLYQYVLTAYDFFKEEKFDVVVQATENWQAMMAQADYASFSRAALRAAALEKLQRWQEAAALWQELRALAPSPLLKDHFELAQAQNLEASGNSQKMFEPDSIIQSSVLRKRILRAAAPTPLLEYVLDQNHTSPEEKSVALAALLHKELLSKQYKALLAHQHKYAPLKLENIDGLEVLRHETISSDENFNCPKWSKVLADLNGDKPPPRALLCLGERLRTLEEGSITPHTPYQDQLGHADDGFNIKRLTRLSLYLAIIGNTSAQGEDEAFALRRALYCFATSGYNHCGPEEIPVEQRKAWFTKLKSKYKSSPWSLKQKYFW
jgi:hypothetical protein